MEKAWLVVFSCYAGVAVGSRLSVHQVSTGAKCLPETPTQGDSMQTWKAWLEDPPCEATVLAEALSQRADGLVASLQKGSLDEIGDVDLVVAGSSFLDRYYVGFHMVLSRVPNRIANISRISGASSGADAPFDMLLMGEFDALRKFLTFGVLGERFNYVYYAGVTDQSYFFAAAHWMVEKYAAKLDRLSDRLWVWMNCKGHCESSWLFNAPCNTSTELHRFHESHCAELAYRATGSVHPPVDVDDEHRQCTDGGVGKVFADGLHAQITMSPTKALNPLKAAIAYTSSEYADGIKMGQDAAIEFLQKQAVSPGWGGKPPVEFCPRGAPCRDPEML